MIKEFLHQIEFIYSNIHLGQMQLLIKDALRHKAGVYAFVCTANNKVYIGSTKNLRKRFMAHLSGLRSNILLQRAILKYGLQSFSFVILEFCAIDQLLEREQFYITSLNPEFNVLKVAGSPLGYKHTEETKAKMSGENHPNYGKPRSDEDRAKKGKKGFIVPEEVKNQISNTLKDSYSGNTPSNEPIFKWE
ncbi:hypothetical protein BC937DRAFT_88883 [Endogone sp. FLAS-F59071]|nr:hypothetical protein BC937DRAFT_88883 [Endogone sp. FLAS-F59071]|eukprot:RUS23416.1 hypothetical protein BC937DRAFT_88883 [Endogone sp. FLAS-F59071]